MKTWFLVLFLFGFFVVVVVLVLFAHARPSDPKLCLVHSEQSINVFQN